MTGTGLGSVTLDGGTVTVTVLVLARVDGVVGGVDGQPGGLDDVDRQAKELER